LEPSLAGVALAAAAERQYNASAMRFLVATLRAIRRVGVVPRRRL
jgi:hypothetical protein